MVKVNKSQVGKSSIMQNPLSIFVGFFWLVHRSNTQLGTRWAYAENANKHIWARAQGL